MSDDFWGDIISRYTRQQAIEDGVLIDITDIGRHEGFRLNLCITSHCYVEHFHEDMDEVKHILSIFHVMIQVMGSKGESIKMNHQDETIMFYIGPGDEGEPVLTLMYPEDL